ncbi:proton-conducting transporter membrane subunit, partial [Corynebacterium diphtheriae]
AMIYAATGTVNMADLAVKLGELPTDVQMVLHVLRDPPDASYVLLTMGGTAQRIRAGVTYVVVSVLSSVVFLIAIAMIYAATGTVNMADLAVKLGELPTDVQMVLHVL